MSTPQQALKALAKSLNVPYEEAGDSKEEKKEKTLLSTSKTPCSFTRGRNSAEVFRMGRNKGHAMFRGQRLAALPPPIHATPRLRHTYRFVNVGTSGTVSSVSVGELHFAAGCLATSTTTIYSLASSIKLHWIKVWSAAVAQTAGAASNSVVVNWSTAESSLAPDDNVTELLPSGITSTACAVFVPPKSSTASFWLQAANDSSTTLFQISSEKGSIVDVNFEWTISNNVQNVSNSSNSGLTAGNVYYGGLDSAVFSSANYSPVGLTA
jgi:hypothetical protein